MPKSFLFEIKCDKTMCYCIFLGSEHIPVKNLGTLYTMPDYTDPLAAAKIRPRRQVESSTSQIPVKWRDPSRHSLRTNHTGSGGATPRHKDIYNEYITQKQSLHYHHPTMPPVLQTQK